MLVFQLVVSPDAVSIYMKTISSLRAGAVSSLRPRAPGPENWLSHHFQSESEGGAQQEGDLCFLQKGEVTRLKSLPSGIGTALRSWKSLPQSLVKSGPNGKKCSSPLKCLIFLFFL